MFTSQGSALLSQQISRTGKSKGKKTAQKLESIPHPSHLKMRKQIYFPGVLEEPRNEDPTQTSPDFRLELWSMLVWLCSSAMLYSLPQINNCSLCNCRKKFQGTCALKSSGKLQVTRKSPNLHLPSGRERKKKSLFWGMLSSKC